MSEHEVTRRDFLKSAVAGAAAVAVGGCALSDIQTAVPMNTSFPVPRRRLGSTGLEASILGYGSHISEDVMKTPGEREKQIRYALDHGINFFDIYPNPGPQFEVMSKLLEPVSKDVIISVYMPMTEDPLGSFENILKIFKRDQLDMVRMWTGGKAQARPANERIYADMAKAKEQGKTRAIGLSGHREEYLTYELAKLKFDYALIIYNFHENNNGYRELMPIARERGMALIGMKSFGMGSLIEFAKNARAQKTIKDEPGVSVPLASLRYVYQNPDIVIAIPAMYSVPELQENLKAVQERKLAADEKTLLERISQAAGPGRCHSENFKA